MVDPTNVFAMDDIKFMTGFNVEPVVASEGSIREAIDRFYATQQTSALEDVMKEFEDSDDVLELEATQEELAEGELERAAGEAPVVKLVNIILRESVNRGASDIHLEPYEKDYRVRFRIDGSLQQVMAPPIKMRDGIISRVKIMAKLDIAEKRLPQDGRIMIRFQKDGKVKQLDFRVSVLPTLHGEKVVMRLLDKENLRLDMTKLGFEQESLTKFDVAILKAWGMVLVTGPTGSGKSTTLAAMIDKVNNERHDHIITIEDPIEFLHSHKNCLVNQREVHSDTHSFANSLRAALREDPDVVLIGEMRDLETIEAALRIAETGHLTFGTLTRTPRHRPSTASWMCSRRTSSRRFGRSSRWCSKESFANRCCRKLRDQGGRWRWKSWFQIRPSGT